MRVQVFHAVIVLTFATAGMAQELPIVKQSSHIGFTVGGGWGRYAMDDLNSHYIDEFAKHFGFLDDNVTNGPSLFGEVNIPLHDRIILDLGIHYRSAEVSHMSTSPGTDETGNPVGTIRFDVALHTSVTSPYMQVNYLVPTSLGNISIGAGVSYGYGRAKIKSTAEYIDTPLPPDSPNPISQTFRFKGSGVGYSVDMNFLRPLNRLISLGFSTGYHIMETETLKQSDGSTWLVEYTDVPRPINLDFTGPYVMGVISITP